MTIEFSFIILLKPIPVSHLFLVTEHRVKLVDTLMKNLYKLAIRQTFDAKEILIDSDKAGRERKNLIGCPVCFKKVLYFTVIKGE